MNCSSQEVRRILEQHDRIVLTAHVSPDGDAIGSLLAMQEWLEGLGKEVVVAVDDDIDDKFFFLPLAEQIRRPDQVQTDASWLTVVLDATGMDRIGAADALAKGKVLNIDHHISNLHFADWEYVRTDCAATGEILTELLEDWQAEFSPSMANALYMAIATDCGFFKFSNTTGHTLRMAALLVEAGAQPNVVSEHLEARSLAKLQALSEVLRHIELFGEGQVACLSFTPDLLQYTGEHTGSYIDYIRTIQGVDVAFTVKYVGPEETRVSLRSKRADVNAVASMFGGGGHVRAAGCTVAAPLEEAKKMIVKELLKVK